MRSMLYGLLALSLATSAAAADGRALVIKSAKAVLNGAKSISVEFTLEYRGNAKMDNRLGESGLLKVKSLGIQMMDQDAAFDDELMMKMFSFKDEYLSPVERTTVGGKETIAWNVKKNPTLVVRRTYDIQDQAFREVDQGRFKQEVVKGRTTWAGRLHRVEGDPKAEDTVDEHPVAALAIGDSVYQIVRWVLCRGGKGLLSATIGKDFDAPDYFSNVDLYFIVDARFQDDVAYTYRVVFQTVPITLPTNLKNMDAATVGSSYQENGAALESPGFQDLTTR